MAKGPQEPKTPLGKLRLTVKALEASPENAEAEAAFLATARDLLADLGVETDGGGDFEHLWPQVGNDALRRAPRGFSVYFVRRLIVEYRRHRDPRIRERLDGLVAGAEEEDSLIERVRPRVLAVAVEDEILAYRDQPDAALRNKILKAVSVPGVQKHIDPSLLWEFLAGEYGRAVDEAALAGNQNDQIQSLRELTAFLHKVKRVHPPNEGRVIDLLHRSLAYAMLHADRPVGAGILRFLRDGEKLRAREILLLFDGEPERLDFVNLYHWATGSARPAEWYLEKFAHHFQLELAFDGKSFILRHR